MSRVKSYEVAKRAGVSRSVVSKIINGSTDRCRIARGTRERVRTAIRETGNRLPSRHVAQGLVAGAAEEFDERAKASMRRPGIRTF